MNGLIFFIFFFLLPLNSFAAAPQPSSAKIYALYCGLDPHSISQNFSFWELYSTTNEGKKALQRGWELLNSHNPHKSAAVPLHLPPKALNLLVNRLVTPSTTVAWDQIDSCSLQAIEAISSHLCNRQLKGYDISDENALLSLPEEEIDLATALLITDSEAKGEEQKKFYCLSLDLMALQIAAKLPPYVSGEQKIRAINDFIFKEQGFRFPPQSKYRGDIDIYTFLPTVLDKKKGVCLGISLVYLCIAQRLGLPLEVITPPGHIYLRYRREDGSYLNIETTARGMHIESEEYLGIEWHRFTPRTIKETVGLMQMNSAAFWWQKENYAKALECYKKALPFLPEDPLLKELMAYQYLFLGEKEKGMSLLHQVADCQESGRVCVATTAKDYLLERTSLDGIQALFLPEEEKRKALLEKKDKLQNIVSIYPQFRSGLFALASCWLKLHRYKEAISCLENYHAIDSEEIGVEFILSVLYCERKDYKNAWRHFHAAKQIADKVQYNPKELKELYRQLCHLSPE